MAHCYEFKGFVPVIPEDTYVHPQAVLIGNVILGHGCYIGPGASLRGDFGKIEIGDGANVQDNCIIHSFPGRGAVVEQDGHVGHGAILHGCIVGRNSLVGMNAVIMDGVDVGAESIVGAQAFVRGGTIVPPRSMVVGAPAKVLREVSDKEIEWKTRGTAEYQQLARDCLAGMTPVKPLTAVEAGRPEAAESGPVCTKGVNMTKPLDWLPDRHLPKRELCLCHLPQQIPWKREGPKLTRLVQQCPSNG